MAKKNSVQFNIQVAPFEGDPNYLKHFFGLISDVSKINNWSDEQAVLFLKSKLTGPALKYFLECDDLVHSKSMNTIYEKFAKFFITKSNAASLADFNNISLLPQESIKHFAHRLHVLTLQAYNEVSDPIALNCLKYNKFISCLPSSLRIKLLEENVTKFNCAVDRAQQLQDIMANELVVQSTQPSSLNLITTNLQNLTEKVNALASSTIPSFDNNVNMTKNNEHGRYHNKGGNSRRFRNKNFPSKKFNKSVCCQICKKNNHTAEKCYKFTNLLKSKNNQRHMQFNNSGNKRNQASSSYVPNNDNLNFR